MQHKHIASRFWNEQKGLSLDTAALARYNDVIDLSLGDTDFTTDRRIIDAAYRDTCAGYTKYGDPQGDPELIAAIQKAYKEDYSLDISRENIFVSASSLMGMSLCMAAMLNPGDEVLLFSPYFSVYRQQVEIAGGVAVEVPTYEQDGYAILEDALRSAITSRTRAMVFNNPNNPTGTVYGRETLELLANICTEFDLVMLADEIYTHYVYDGEFIPVCSLPGMAERTVTLNSFSKNFLMTGWRVGCVIAPIHFINTIMQINGAMVYTAPAPSQRAAIAALSIRDDIVAEYISQYRERVHYATERIASIPYMTLIAPRGTFYIFPGIASTGLASEEFCNRLFLDAHVLASPGSLFGSTGEGHVRFACTVDMPMLKEAFDRMEKLRF